MIVAVAAAAGGAGAMILLLVLYFKCRMPKAKEVPKEVGAWGLVSLRSRTRPSGHDVAAGQQQANLGLQMTSSTLAPTQGLEEIYTVPLDTASLDHDFAFSPREFDSISASPSGPNSPQQTQRGAPVASSEKHDTNMDNNQYI